jgi:hypothetical protein
MRSLKIYPRCDREELGIIQKSTSFFYTYVAQTHCSNPLLKPQFLWRYQRDPGERLRLIRMAVYLQAGSRRVASRSAVHRPRVAG